MATPETKKTAQEISTMIVSQLETEFNQTIPLLPKAFNRIIAKIFGIVFVVLFNFAEFITLQLFIKFASDKYFTIGGQKINPLNEWGSLIGLTRGDGERFEGVATITVIDQSGTLQSGTQLIDTNTEELYLTIGAVPIDAAEIEATVRAINYTASANLEEDAVLSFVSAPPQVQKDVVIDEVLKLGVDPETTDAWRNRQLEWWSSRPQGGAYADFRLWGNGTEGVEQTYPFSGGTPGIPTSGAGQVDNYIEAKDTVDGIAPQPLLDDVKDNMLQEQSTGLASRSPINAWVNVESIFRSEYRFVITGLVVEDFSETQELVETALTNYLLDRENYIVGLSRLPRKDIISQTEASGIVGRIVASQGGLVTRVDLFEKTSEAPTPTYEEKISRVLTEGEKAKIDSFIWI